MADISEHTPLIGEQSGERIPSTRMFCEELNVLTRYSLSVFATYLAEHSFNLASVICIGHLSTVSLAAGTLGMMTASVTGYAIVQGFASTLDTLLPPAWTSDTPHMVGLWTQRTVIMTIIGLIPILTLWFNIEPILLLLKQEPEVAHLAGVFLKYAAWGLPAYSFNCIIKRYFQSQGLFAVPARITLIVAPFNAFLNWFLVYPLGLSFRGAPIASALSFNLVALALILYGYFLVPRTAWIPIGRGIWQGWGLLGRLGIAGIGQIASEWWTWELTAFIAGLLGSVTLAAQSTLLVTVSIAYQAPFAMSVATSVRIGNLLGEGKARRAKVGAQVSIVLGAIIGCTWCTTLLISRSKWTYLFNDDPDVVSLVYAVIPLTALSLVLDAINTLAAGVLRARGMQMMGTLFNLSGYYAFGLPLGFLFTSYSGFHLSSLWVGLSAGLLFSAIVSVWIAVVRADWEVEVKKARARVKEEEVGAHRKRGRIHT